MTNEPVRPQGNERESRLNVGGAFAGALFDLQNLIQDYGELARLEARKFSVILVKAIGALVLGAVFFGNGLGDLMRALAGFAVQAEEISNFQALLLSAMFQLLLCGLLFWYAKRQLSERVVVEAKTDAQKLKDASRGTDPTATSAAKTSANMRPAEPLRH